MFEVNVIECPGAECPSCGQPIDKAVQFIWNGQELNTGCADCMSDVAGSLQDAADYINAAVVRTWFG